MIDKDRKECLMFIAETVTQEQKEYRWKNTVKAVVATRQMLKLSLLGTGGLTVTCKDCLYHHICKIIDVLGEIQGNAECCLQFKDRSRFVELPCKVNLCDEVHFVLRGLDEIDLKEYLCTVGNSAVSDTVQFITEIGTYGFWVGESPREFAPDYDEFYHWHELGKTVFLTREEAEQALKLKERET